MFWLTEFMINAQAKCRHLTILFWFESRLDSSAKHVLEIEDVFKVLLCSKMYFNSRRLPDKTHHTYTQ